MLIVLIETTQIKRRIQLRLKEYKMWWEMSRRKRLRKRRNQPFEAISQNCLQWKKAVNCNYNFYVQRN